MSKQAAKVFIDNYIKTTFKDSPLYKHLTSDFREALDAEISILDLSYTALKANISDELSKAIEPSTLLVDFKKSHELLKRNTRKSISTNRTFTSIDKFNEALVKRNKNVLQEGLAEKFLKSGPVLIEEGAKSFFIIGTSFGSLRSFTTDNISEKMSNDIFFGMRTYTYIKEGETAQSTGKRSRLDIGHIASAGTEISDNLRSPLGEKLKSIALGDSSSANIAKRSLAKLYKIQAKYNYTFRNTTPEVIRGTQKVLGKGYVVLTLHNEDLNNDFSVKESAVYREFLYNMGKKLGKELHKVSGSNTITQDVGQHLFNVLSANNKKLKSHDLVNSTVVESIKVSIPKSLNATKIPGQLRTVKGQFTSLISIQNLLNQGLASQIEQNMGDGDRKDILNYRSGRFAESAQVERMSQSREGMITAFYSYMRNPYATFSFGGQQSDPISRDPKLLISKSIREIGATIVGNRMRAVLV